MQSLSELFDEKATWHTPGRSPIGGNHQGRAAIIAQFGRFASETGGTFKANLQHILKGDDNVVVGAHHNSAVRNGKRLEIDCCILFKFKNGKVIDASEHYYDVHAWDEFWS